MQDTSKGANQEREVLLAQKLDLAFYFLLDKLFHLASSNEDSSGKSSSRKEKANYPNSDLLRLRHCRPDNRKRLMGWNPGMARTSLSVDLCDGFQGQ